MARGNWASPAYVAPSLGTPASGTAVAVRASQPLKGNLIDQGPNANTMTNTGLVATGWLASAAVSLGAYRTSVTPDGRLYKCTTAGTNASTEPSWNTTIGGTTTSGTAVYTTEKGPYFVDASGDRLFRSIASAQIGGPGVFQAPAPALLWDMALEQSLIVNLRFKQDFNATGQGAASPIFSNRELTGTNRGFRITATGSTAQCLRFNVRDNLGNSIFTDDFSSNFNRKVLDGTIRNVCWLICGALKISYLYVDGIPVTQADMFNGSSICPNGLNLASITGTTQGGALTIGGDPLGTTSFECAFKSIDVTVLPGGLPANIQDLALWYTRGGEGVLPQALVR